MSILGSTNSGIIGQPLTPETAQKLGWIITQDTGQTTGYNANGKPNNWRCIGMKYKDETICAPLRFWYEPHDKIKYVSFDFWVFGQDELNLSREEFGNNSRIITNVKELLDCLEFVYLSGKYEKELKNYWKTKLSHLKKKEL